MTQTYDVIVEGAGINGLVAATALGKAGRKVLLVDSRPWLGGLASGPEVEGNSAVGPLQESSAFREDLARDLNLEKLGLQFLDGAEPVFLPELGPEGLTLSGNPQIAAQAIAALCQEDGDAYLRYCAFIQRVRPFVNRLFTDLPAEIERLTWRDWRELAIKGLAFRRLRESDRREILRIPVMCVADWMKEQFVTPALRAALAVPALRSVFGGPWSPGTTLNLLWWACGRGRAVEGGLPALINVLEKAARQSGVEVQSGRSLTSLSLKNQRLVGVVASDGENLSCRHFLSTRDPHHVFFGLLGPHHLSMTMARSLKNYRMRGSAGLLRLDLNGEQVFRCKSQEIPRFVRFGRSLDDLERAFDPVKYGEIPTKPMVEGYLCKKASSQRLNLLVRHLPHTPEKGWNDETKQRVWHGVRAVMAPYLDQLPEQLPSQDVLVPSELGELYGIGGGDLYQGEIALDQMLVRPLPQCPHYHTSIQGLWLGGASTAPAGSISGLPGWRAAKALLAQ